MTRALVIVLAGMSLGACSMQDDRASSRTLERSFARLEEPARDVHAGPVIGYVSLPGDAKKIGPISEHRYGDGFTQEIRSQDDDAQTVVQLSVRQAAATLDESIMLEKPSETSIRAELSARFPNIAMKVVETPRSNANGRYGMAVGSLSDGTRCAYLWQWIDDPVRLQAIPNATQASVRVRMCRPTVTFDDLASRVSSVRLGLVTASASNGQTMKPKAAKPRVRDAIASSQSNRRSVKRVVTHAEPQPAAVTVADGAPRYIVPLAGTSAAEAPAPSIPLPRPLAVNESAPLQRSASATDTRLNLPPEAYNARKVPGLEASPARLIAADPAAVTGTTR